MFWTRTGEGRRGGGFSLGNPQYIYRAASSHIPPPLRRFFRPCGAYEGGQGIWLDFATRNLVNSGDSRDPKLQLFKHFLETYGAIFHFPCRHSHTQSTRTCTRTCTHGSTFVSIFIVFAPRTRQNGDVDPGQLGTARASNIPGAAGARKFLGTAGAGKNPAPQAPELFRRRRPGDFWSKRLL